MVREHACLFFPISWTDCFLVRSSSINFCFIFFQWMVQEHAWFCSSQFVLIDSLLDFKSPTDIPTLRSRFACFHPLMVHLLKVRPILLLC